MDWTSLASLSKAKNIHSILQNVQKLNLCLTGSAERFQPEAFMAPDAIPRILAYLRAQPGRGETSLSNHTIINYLSNVSSVFKLLGLDSSAYRTAVSTIEKTRIPKALPNMSKELVRRKLEDQLAANDQRLRVMAAILLYRVRVKLVDLTRTKVGDDGGGGGGGEYYLDLNQRVWKIKGTVLSVPAEFIAAIKVTPSSQWLLGQPLDKSNILSMLFKQHVRLTFSEAAALLEQ
jgi:hypothetical protein